MNTTVFNAINEQINSEFEASYTYLQPWPASARQQRFSGAAKWLRSQSDEERQHGLKLFDFVLARDGAVDLKTIEAEGPLRLARRGVRAGARALSSASRSKSMRSTSSVSRKKPLRR